jgi:hypothetical protein
MGKFDIEKAGIDLVEQEAEEQLLSNLTDDQRRKREAYDKFQSMQIFERLMRKTVQKGATFKKKRRKAWLQTKKSRKINRN